MKKITFFAAIAMIAFTTNAVAQATATGTSTTTVIAPITISAGTDLAFGNVTEDGTGGTVTVTAAATAVATGTSGAQAVDGTVTAGAFTVTGQAGNTYSITVPTAPATLTGLDVSAPTITVSGFTSDIATGSIGTTNTFYVGADITLAGPQLPDTYSGSYDVTVQYL